MLRIKYFHLFLFSLILGTIPQGLYAQGAQSFQIFLRQGQSSSIVGNGQQIELTSPVGRSASAVLTFTYQGTATALINAANLIAPPSFSIVSPPAFPVSLVSGRSIDITVRFAPTLNERFTGILSLPIVENTAQGSNVGTITLSLLGTTPDFRFAVIAPPDNNIVPIAGGAAVTFPDTAPGSTSQITMVVLNRGSGAGRVESVAVSGLGFQVTGLSSFLPQSIAPGQELRFTLRFAPLDVTTMRGSLSVGIDQRTETVALEGRGVGASASLSCRFTIDGISTTFTGGGSVSFPSTQIGNSTSMDLEIQSAGSTAVTIRSVSLDSARSPYRIVGLPALPLTLSAGQTLRLVLQFIPMSIGANSETLRINDQTFSLAGVGTRPPNLPPYTIGGPEGSVRPLQQPAVELTLGTPYPLAISGTLSIAVVPDAFEGDPAVQFSTGGRTVSFTIPANTTRAMFPNSSNQIRLQTGSLAGAIVITPSFAVADGIDLTPSTPTTLTMNIGRLAPQLLSAEITDTSSSGFTIVITGYAVTRALDTLNLTFAPQGTGVQGLTFNLNAKQQFDAWYRSSSAEDFGSLFTASIPFVIQRASNDEDTSIPFSSISVTAANEIGTSNTITYQVPKP